MSNQAQRVQLTALLRHHGLPDPVAEHRFHPTRRWRFDYCWPTHRVALEVDGGIYTGGRHTRGAGTEGDHEKFNEAAVLGWRVLRVTPRKLLTSATMGLLQRVLCPLTRADLTPGG